MVAIFGNASNCGEPLGRKPPSFDRRNVLVSKSAAAANLVGNTLD
jgi:hypothetical protein